MPVDAPLDQVSVVSLNESLDLLFTPDSTSRVREPWLVEMRSISIEDSDLFPSEGSRVDELRADGNATSARANDCDSCMSGKMSDNRVCDH